MIATTATTAEAQPICDNKGVPHAGCKYSD